MDGGSRRAAGKHSAFFGCRELFPSVRNWLLRVFRECFVSFIRLRGRWFSLWFWKNVKNSAHLPFFLPPSKSATELRELLYLPLFGIERKFSCETEVATVNVFLSKPKCFAWFSVFSSCLLIFFIHVVRLVTSPWNQLFWEFKKDPPAELKDMDWEERESHVIMGTLRTISPPVLLLLNFTYNRAVSGFPRVLKMVFRGTNPIKLFCSFASSVEDRVTTNEICAILNGYLHPCSESRDSKRANRFSLDA